MLRAHSRVLPAWLGTVLPRVIHGAEIGVWEGKTSAELLRYHAELTLILVDPWKVYADQNYEHTTIERMALAKERALSRIEKYMDRVVLIEKPSLKACNEVEDTSLDFVFIDGWHLDIVADLQAWYPKVRIGGIFCGHDYELMSVIKPAVDAFAEEYDRNVETLRGYIWWFRK